MPYNFLPKVWSRNAYWFTTDIWDRIWLSCDIQTLQNTRELHSEHVRKRIPYFTLNEAAKSGSLESMK